VGVKGEYHVYPSPHLTIIPNTKEHTHAIIPNIKKRQEYIYLKKGKRKDMKKKPHQFCTFK